MLFSRRHAIIEKLVGISEFFLSKHIRQSLYMNGDSRRFNKTYNKKARVVESISRLVEHNFLEDLGEYDLIDN